MNSIKKWPDLGLIIMGLMLALISGIGIAVFGMTWLQYLGAAFLIIIVFFNPYIGLYAMLVIIPVYALSITESGGTLAKNIGVLTFVAWIASQVAQRKTLRQLTSSSISLPMGIFWLVGVISIVWSASLNSWSIAMLTFTQLIAFTIMLINMANSFAEFQRLFLFFSLGNLINAYISITQFSQLYGGHAGMFRVAGGAGTANLTASIMVTGLPFLFFFLERRKGTLRWFGFLGILFLVIGITLTLSRTGFVLMCLFFLWKLFEWRKFNLRTIGILVLLAIAVIVLMQYAPWGLLRERFVQVPGDLSLAGGDRGWLVNKAFQMILARPFGYGAGNLYYGGEYFIVHNMYLQIIAEFSIVGFLAIARICYVLLKNLLSAKDATLGSDTDAYAFTNAILISLVLFLLYSLTGSSERSRILWMLFGLAEACYIMVKNAYSILNSRS